MKYLTRLLLPAMILCICGISNTNAQKSTNPVIYVTGVPTNCVSGRVYVNRTTGFVYTYKTGVGCFVISGATVSTTKVYRANLTQTGENAPVATVLENSLGGTLVWSRINTGVYEATLTGAFPTTNKVFIMAPRYVIDNELSNVFYAYIGVTDANSIGLTVGAIEAPSDGKLVNFPIEIAVYP